MYTSLILPQAPKKACCSACAHGHSKCGGGKSGMGYLPPVAMAAPYGADPGSLLASYTGGFRDPNAYQQWYNPGSLLASYTGVRDPNAYQQSYNPGAIMQSGNLDYLPGWNLPLPPRAGVGLFDVGVEWGLAEYAALGVGAYVLLSLFGDYQTAKKGFKRGYAAARAKG